ncbi:MAG: phosphoenolpyruvate mutase [Alphaproteobacteria bacterium]
MAQRPVALPQTASADEQPSKAARLRAMLTAPDLSFIMEAHNGLSAKIVEQAGFEGIWASGLSISAALGVRDSNEASWTQVLEVLEFMSDATRVPILVDGDTGYGNFNNVRRLVRKLCQRNIAGVCIEDKLFPKTNSFIGDAQPLADIGEFCGKIKAGKDSQLDDDFRMVARIEALISGWGLDEALRRAEAYHAAGADAILVHSKLKTADEILRFMAEWGGRCPVVIVPTMYHATPTEAFAQAGISMVIWANHNLRAAITAMREVSERIRREGNLSSVEGRVASVQDVFDLSENAELNEAERRYLGPAKSKPKAVVLAASRGSTLEALTADRPKCMVDIRGQPLLRRLVGSLREQGLRDVTVVRGYRKEAVTVPSIRVVDNDAYETTGEVASLACAETQIQGECLISYGDILFRNHILSALLDAPGDIVLSVDALWKAREGVGGGRTRDLVNCSRPSTAGVLDDQPAHITGIGDILKEDSVDGEWVGLTKLSPRGAALVREEIAAMREDGTWRTAGLPDLFGRLVSRGVRLDVTYVAGQWLDVNDAFDLANARNFL